MRSHITVIHRLTFTYNCRRALHYQDGDPNSQKEVTNLQDRRNILQSRLNAWFKIQMVYIPVAQRLRDDQHNDNARVSGRVQSDEELEDTSRRSMDVNAENATLFLPSQLPLSLWGTGCMSGLHKIELKLRIAQAGDALEQLKHHLCVYSGLVHYKIRQVSGPGQKANTRARSLLMRIYEKVTRTAERYRVSRAALEVLDPTGDWRDIYRLLLKKDIQGPNGKSLDDMDGVLKMSKRSKRTGEGLRELSWIWRVRCKVTLSEQPSIEGASVEGSATKTETDVDRCEFFLSRNLHLILISIISSKSGICEGQSESDAMA